MEIKVDYNKIEGFIEQNGSTRAVMSLNERNGEWTVGSSTCYPSDVEEARKMLGCENACFAKLDEILTKENETVVGIIPLRIERLMETLEGDDDGFWEGNITAVIRGTVDELIEEYNELNTLYRDVTVTKYTKLQKVVYYIDGGGHVIRLSDGDKVLGTYILRGVCNTMALEYDRTWDYDEREDIGDLRKMCLRDDARSLVRALVADYRELEAVYNLVNSKVLKEQ